jgi:hypothetical protein
MIPVIQQSISRAQQQADTADTRSYNKEVVTEERAYQSANAETLRKADVTRATEQAEALITGGEFSDAQANAIRAAAAAGTEALNAVRTLAASKAWVAKHTILPQTEAKLLGYPDGSIVSRNDETQEVELKYNPNPDKLNEYNAITARINATKPPPGVTTAQVTSLRKEFNGRQEVQDYRLVRNAYQNVLSTTTNPSAAGDLSKIFAYMKMLDPNSAVKEQEFANAQNAAGVPDQIRNQYNRALRGTRLTPKQRLDFDNQAKSLYTNREERFRTIEREYTGYADGYGIDPQLVVGDSVQAPTPTPGATVGNSTVKGVRP